MAKLLREKQYQPKAINPKKGEYKREKLDVRHIESEPEDES